MDDEKKPGWYFIRNSSRKYDGAWTLSVFSFIFIIIVTLVALGAWVGLWAYYYHAISTTANTRLVAAIKPPSFRFSDIAAWVASFGGMVLAPTIAAYVARKHEIGKPVPPPIFDRTPVTIDDDH